MPKRPLGSSAEDGPPVPPQFRRPWHELLKRVFDLDIICDRCGSSGLADGLVITGAPVATRPRASGTQVPTIRGVVSR